MQGGAVVNRRAARLTVLLPLVPRGPANRQNHFRICDVPKGLGSLPVGFCKVKAPGARDRVHCGLFFVGEK